MIELKHITKTFTIRNGLSRRVVHAVTDATLTVKPEETIAIVGESGCGKSTLGRIISGLMDTTSGSITWNGHSVDARRRKDVIRYRHAVQLVHQDPYAALNPVRRIGNILAEPLLAHKIVKRGQVLQRVHDLLASVGLDAEMIMKAYPHQLSGGQRQRILLARALTVEPQFLVADEAVSMVDVSQRLGILELFKSIMREHQLGLVFITHDLRVARYIAGEGLIAVMYLGRIVEVGPAEVVLNRPRHPYTRCLLSAVPLLRGREKNELDIVIPRSYEVPDAVDIPPGCAFEPRCPFANDECRRTRPLLNPSVEHNHVVACHVAAEFGSSAAKEVGAVSSTDFA